MKEIQISVSTNPAENDLQYIKELEKLNVNFIHCDVMQKKFISTEKGLFKGLFGFKNITDMDYVRVKLYDKMTSLPLDVHLMVKNPTYLLYKYKKAGANIITLHYEAYKSEKQLIYALQTIKKYGIKAGIAINPETRFSAIKNIVGQIDLLVIMSVKPGLSGQKFITSTLNKISQANKYRENNSLKYLIEVDGGINRFNSNIIIEQGADILVSGSYIYNSANKKQALEVLRGKIRQQ
ncbi:MAG: ribulose-phosphate 3-epimerase [Clostridia bacterium]|jgi:ribulose-phosphate 3-epimerase|nr:ribulose-phosphate 3-epimerase [Clostridia bacterium]MDD4275826.1 ribulose-phosphate 3-epimerase [Clostridia bacterium]